MKIQIDIPNELNLKIKLYKDIEGLGTLQEAIIKITKDYFKIMNIKLRDKVVFE